jgi:hypothetical protein
MEAWEEETTDIRKKQERIVFRCKLLLSLGVWLLVLYIFGCILINQDSDYAKTHSIDLAVSGHVQSRTNTSDAMESQYVLILDTNQTCVVVSKQNKSVGQIMYVYKDHTTHPQCSDTLVDQHHYDVYMTFAMGGIVVVGIVFYLLILQCGQYEKLENRFRFIQQSFLHV